MKRLSLLVIGILLFISVDAQKGIADNEVNILYTTMYGLPKDDATHLTPSGLEEHRKRIFNAYQRVSSANKKPIDVYLIGGQSNATGQGYLKNIPADFKIDKSVQFYYSKGRTRSRTGTDTPSRRSSFPPETD